MEISIHLRHGPLEIEIEADREDNYQQEILDILNFIEENHERFNNLTPQQDEEDGDEYEQAPADSDIWERGAPLNH